MPPIYEIGAFAHTSDSQPVTDRNRHQKAFRYRWTQGLDEGVFFLVARIATGDFRPIKEARQLLRVQ